MFAASRQLKPLSLLPVSFWLLLRYSDCDFVAMGFQLTFLQDSMSNKQDYLELGLNCADICTALVQGMNVNGKQPRHLSRSVRDAISHLTMWVKGYCSSNVVLTMRLITIELPRISRETPSRRPSAATFLDSSIQRMIRTRSLLGS